MRTCVDLHASVDGDGMAATLMPVMTDEMTSDHHHWINMLYQFLDFFLTKHNEQLLPWLYSLIC